MSTLTAAQATQLYAEVSGLDNGIAIAGQNWEDLFQFLAHARYP